MFDLEYFYDNIEYIFLPIMFCNISDAFDNSPLKKQIESLQSQLHYILGGAQVCAAESLIQLITDLKHSIKTTGLIDKTSENLWQEINAVNFAMQRCKK